MQWNERYKEATGNVSCLIGTQLQKHRDRVNERFGGALGHLMDFKDAADKLVGTKPGDLKPTVAAQLHKSLDILGDAFLMPLTEAEYHLSEHKKTCGVCGGSNE